MSEKNYDSNPNMYNDTNSYKEMTEKFKKAQNQNQDCEEGSDLEDYYKFRSNDEDIMDL